MTDVTVVCVKCGREKVYDSFREAESRGWTLGNLEYCGKCEPDKPIPRVPDRPPVWYKFHWYICLLRGGKEDNLKLDRIRRADTYFMTYWNQRERSETWVEDTLTHWHLYPKDFSWQKYRDDRDTWLKYNASLEQRALNYHFVVWTFEEHKRMLTDYWTGCTLEIV